MGGFLEQAIAWWGYGKVSSALDQLTQEGKSPSYARGQGADPYSLRFTLQHPLARMLPLYAWPRQVYRLGEKVPPGLKGYTPIWEVFTATLAGLANTRLRINVQRDFHVLAVIGSSSAAGGFKAQFYDTAKKRTLSDRGENFGNLTTGTAGQRVIFLRTPYEFDVPDSQVLCVIQNQAAGANTVQIVLYGVALRWNE